MPLKAVGNKYQWLFHVLGIIMFLSFPVLDLPHHFKESNPFLSPFVQRDIIGYVLIILFFYLCYYVLIDRFFFTKKYVVFLLIVMGCVLLIAFLPELIISQRKIDACVEFKKACQNNKQNFPMKAGPASKAIFLLKLFNHVVFKIIVALLFAMLLKIYVRLKNTQEEKVNAEVSFLRAQVNPHFLFNSLNSIYSLSITKSDQAPTAVATLSDMMRYVLSQNDDEFVDLEKELNYIRDYISMQELRLTQQTHLLFSIDGKTTGLKIAPMLLIPFIENAFKYGVNPNRTSSVKIQIKVEQQNLELYVYNQKVVEHTDKVNGVGIVNVKSRLALIYPDRYKLLENSTETDYTINLKLTL